VDYVIVDCDVMYYYSNHFCVLYSKWISCRLMCCYYMNHFYRATLCWCGICCHRVSVCLSVLLSVCHNF